MASKSESPRGRPDRGAPSSSGRFLLRVPPPLHAALQATAREAGVSLNEYCVRRLAAPGGALALAPDAAPIVIRAAEVAGTALVAVVVHGSWSRGEADAASDIDVLVVVDRELELTRTLYRSWDQAPLTWRGHIVEPHFAHLATAPVTGGVWAEVAVDGLVLFERDLRVSTLLMRVRRDIADGRLVRHVSHGQSYWTVAA